MEVSPLPKTIMAMQDLPFMRWITYTARTIRFQTAKPTMSRFVSI